MLTTLKTAYTDTRAADLAWALGREPLPALAVLDLDSDGSAGSRNCSCGCSAPPTRCSWRRSGAAVRRPSPASPGSSTPLPLGVAKRSATGSTSSRPASRRCRRGSFAGRAQELLALVADHPHGLAGTFPGTRTPSPRCSPSATRARCAGAPGTRTRRRGSWWRPGPGWGMTGDAVPRRARTPRARSCHIVRRMTSCTQCTRVGDEAPATRDVAFTA